MAGPVRRESVALLSLSLSGSASFVQRIEERGEVVLVEHSVRRQGIGEIEAAKGWAQKMVAWVEGGKLGAEPHPMADDLTTTESTAQPAQGAKRTRLAAALLTLFYIKPFVLVLAPRQVASNAVLLLRKMVSVPDRIYTATIHDIQSKRFYQIF